MQTVLITGANGFIGFYLVKKLLEKRFNVMATGRGENRLPFKDENFSYQPLDFTQEEEVKNIIQTYKPDIIVHGGAISKPDDCEQNKEKAYASNVLSTKYLLEQAALIKSFFLFVSTDFVFSGEKEIYREEEATAPVNYYGETKQMAEAEVQKYPFGWSIVRTILVYGKPISGRQNLLTTVAAALKRGEELNIYDDQVRTPTYVEDLVDGMATIVEKKANGIYHLSGEDVLTPYDIAVAVAGYLGLNEKLIHKVTAEAFQQPAKRPPKTIFDLTKAKRDLAYKVTPFNQGLQKTFEV